MVQLYRALKHIPTKNMPLNVIVLCKKFKLYSLLLGSTGSRRDILSLLKPNSKSSPLQPKQ